METKNEAQVFSYLTFKLGDEEFASHVSKVLNILEMTKITKVPKSPSYMKGVINLRGMVLPVIDTRLKFGMDETEVTDNTCIIVTELDMDGDTVNVGAIVDQVLAVVELNDNDIQPPPSIGNKFKTDFISGMAKLDERFIMILDLEKIFSTDEIIEMKNTSTSEA